jgi:NADH-quinone oxidoreductase subunit C
VEWSPSFGQNVAVVPRESLRRFAEGALEAGFEVCVDVTAVDFLRSKPIRFEVVAGLLSHRHNLRLRLRVPVPGDDPEVPSLTPIWPGANFFEREAFDMFGIRFSDHPDLTRILMPDEWIGHPLRKDYQVGEVPVQFKGAPKAV